MLNRRITLAFLVAAATSLAAPARASAGTLHAHSGAVSATVTYTGSQAPGQEKNLKLTIVRSGKTVVAHRAITYHDCGGYCVIAGLDVANVEGNGEPDVVVDLFTGGAHCCWIGLVYRYHAGGYTPIARSFGNGDYRIERIGGRQVFLTTDDRFYYAFASFAASGAPIQIISVSGGRFRDVTRGHTERIMSDAAFWWKTYLSNANDQQSETEGVFADWAADQELLGHGALVQKRLAAELAKHHLHGMIAANKYGKALIAFLRHTGYIR